MFTPQLIYLVPLMSFIEAQAPLPLTAVPLVFVALLMGLLIPQLCLLAGSQDVHPTSSRPASSPIRRQVTHCQCWLVPLSVLLASVLLLLAVVATSGFSGAQPGANSVTYQLQADTGKGVRSSNHQRLDECTRQFFTSSGESGPFSAQAPAISLPAPDVALKSDTMSGTTRTLRMQVVSPRHAEDAMVQVETQGVIVAVTVDGRSFDLKALPRSAHLVTCSLHILRCPIMALS